jgi:two-component system, response regulator PdtaR
VDQTRPVRTSVLVVDDEPLLRLALVDLFEDAHYTVLEAGSAAEALDVLRVSPDVRVVVTDIQMPGSMDGLRLAQYIHDAYPPIALIVASGAVTPGEHELPVTAIFMPKPVNFAALLAQVEVLVARADGG